MDSLLVRVLDVLVFGSVVGLCLWSHYYAVVTCPLETNNGFQTDALVAFFADPQIEGDAKIRNFGLAGRIEVSLNDLYHHIIVSAISRLNVTHAVTLGDLFSSETLSPKEFKLRHERLMWQFAPIFENVPTINITGNHDIGYGYLVREQYLRNFEKAFGPANSLVHIAGHVFCNVNGMTLEGAPKRLMTESWNQVNLCAEEASKTKEPLILITHMPLPNPDGDKDGCDPYKVLWDEYHKMITKQNHVTKESASKLLRTLNPVMVFAGHDHDGCFYKLGEDKSIPQYTVRSMMGDFSGNVQLLAIGHIDHEDGTTSVEYSVRACSLRLKMVHYVYAAISVFTYSVFRLVFSCYKGNKRQKTE